MPIPAQDEQLEEGDIIVKRVTVIVVSVGVELSVL